MKNKFIKNLVFVIVSLFLVCFVSITLFKDMKFGLDLQGGFEILYQVKSINDEEVTSDMVKSTYKTLLRRIDGLGVSEPELSIEGERIRVKLAGVYDQDSAIKMLNRAASLTFRDTSDNLLMTSDVLKDGGARVSQDEYGNYVIGLSIADKEQFYKVTKQVSEMQDNRIVIWLDFDASTDKYQNYQSVCGKVDTEEAIAGIKCLSSASVREGFADDVIIQGNFTKEEVENLVELINSGSLTTKLEEISSHVVSASFGEDSLSKTVTAGLIGIAIIIIFMIIVYRFAGFVAGIGMMIYTCVTLFVFWLIGGVLTLPGIAAMVIGIGMAIDANVINFARIKDELYEGTKLQMAYKNGNKNSFMTIFDSNLTTLLVAIILFIFGESSVKGFATMLIISTLVTMVIMVFLTRWLLGIFVKTGYFDNKIRAFIGVKEADLPKLENNEKRTKNAFKGFDFIGKYKLILVCSIIFIGAGIFSLFTTKLNLGIDFKGGSTITLVADNEISEDSLKEDVEELQYELNNIEYLADGSIVITINDELSDQSEDNNQKEIAKNYFKEKYDADASIGVVTNVVKRELVKNAFISLAIAIIGIIVYISLRFSFSYAVGAIMALIWDVFFIVALFSFLRLEVSSIFIAAILSIIGYSINDTIVTFDRVRENINKEYKGKIGKKEELKEAINLSLRQTLNRSIITTITTLIPVVALVVLGSGEIFNFNIALLFGLVSGVYSSIFVATQILYLLEKRNVGKPAKKKWYEDDDEVKEKKIKGINC